MAIYEVSHIYDKKYFRNDRVIFMVGEKKNDNVLCEANFVDNIANKNKNYCELTGIYAIFKNIQDDFYGIEHYRRYFCNCWGQQIKTKNVQKLLKKGKFILPIQEVTLPNVFLHYSMHHYMADLEALRELFRTDYVEYLPSFESVMASNKISIFNMFVCNSDEFYNYCEWLFEILFKLEKKVDINKYSPYQARLFGFIGERLLNVWVLHNVPKKNIVYRYVAQTGEKKMPGLKIFYHTLISNFKKR